MATSLFLCPWPLPPWNFREGPASLAELTPALPSPWSVQCRQAVSPPLHRKCPGQCQCEPLNPKGLSLQASQEKLSFLLLQPLHPGSPYPSKCSFLGLHWLVFRFPPLKSNCPQSSLLPHTRCCSFTFPSPVASAPPYKTMPFKSVSSCADPQIQLPCSPLPQMCCRRF